MATEQKWAWFDHRCQKISRSFEHELLQAADSEERVNHYIFRVADMFMHLKEIIWTTF